MAKDGTHDQFETIDGAGHPEPRTSSDRLRQQRIGTKDVFDAGRICVEVEQPPDARDEVADASDVVDVDACHDMAVVGAG